MNSKIQVYIQLQAHPLTLFLSQTDKTRHNIFHIIVFLILCKLGASVPLKIYTVKYSQNSHLHIPNLLSICAYIYIYIYIYIY